MTTFDEDVKALQFGEQTVEELIEKRGFHDETFCCGLGCQLKVGICTLTTIGKAVPYLTKNQEALECLETAEREVMQRELPRVPDGRVDDGVSASKDAEDWWFIINYL